MALQQRAAELARRRENTFAGSSCSSFHRKRRKRKKRRKRRTRRTVSGLPEWRISGDDFWHASIFFDSCCCSCVSLRWQFVFFFSTHLRRDRGPRLLRSILRLQRSTGLLIWEMTSNKMFGDMVIRQFTGLSPNLTEEFKILVFRIPFVSSRHLSMSALPEKNQFWILWEMASRNVAALSALLGLTANTGTCVCLRGSSEATPVSVCVIAETWNDCTCGVSWGVTVCAVKIYGQCGSRSMFSVQAVKCSWCCLQVDAKQCVPRISWWRQW